MVDINFRLVSNLQKVKVQAGIPIEQKGNLEINPAKQTHETLPANIILILDCSGSMSGDPLDLLNKAIDKVSSNLRENDKISMISFSSEASIIVQEKSRDELFNEGIPVLTSQGGTNFKAAFGLGLELIKQNTSFLSKVDAKRYSNVVIFMSDGNPTVHGWKKLPKEYLKLGFTIHSLGLGSNVNPNTMLEIAEAAGGTYEHADSPDELEESLLNIIDLSQDIVLHQPILRMKVFPGSKVSNVCLVAPPKDLLKNAKIGLNEITLPDLATDSNYEIIYDLKIDKPGKVNQKQDLIEWSMDNSTPVTTYIMWVDEATSYLSGVNTTPIILEKIYKGFDAVKKGDTQMTQKTITQLNNFKNNPLSQSAVTILKESTKGDISAGKKLSLISKTTTNPNGKLKKLK
ncbi:MAG: vWA domain-containing protein [Promethearchaeota archaeon]